MWLWLSCKIIEMVWAVLSWSLCDICRCGVSCESSRWTKYTSEVDSGLLFFFFQAEDGIRDLTVTGVQTCALPIYGRVLKIEPQAQVNQNVTMFPVIVNILNPNHQLKPGMNSEVEIHVGDRRNVLAVPNAALRTPRDVASAAQVLGLDLQTVQQQLVQAETPRSVARDTADAGKLHAAEATKPGARATFTTPSGRTITLPPGVMPEQVQAAFAKRMSGAELTPAEQALLAPMRSQGGGRQGRTANGGGGGSYIVFVLRGGRMMAVPIRTGLTDQDYIEVTGGLTEQDTVLVLPSASLVQSQQQFRQRFQNVTGGGLPGVRQQQAQPATPR